MEKLAYVVDLSLANSKLGGVAERASQGDRSHRLVNFRRDRRSAAGEIAIRSRRDRGCADGEVTLHISRGRSSAAFFGLSERAT